MSNYGFILEDMYFSYSSISGFDTCKHQFFLTYINAEERGQNFYSQYGSHIHDVLEKYFKGELKSYQLSDYYSENYDKSVTLNPPAFQKNVNETYREKGQVFFDYFSFDKDLYDVVLIEGSLKVEIDGVKLVVKPDLILKEKSTGKHVLFDYKSSNGFLTSGKRDNKKFTGYIKQMYLYKHYIKKVMDIDIEDIVLWFPRYDRMEHIEIDIKEETKTVEWFQNTIKNILNEEDFVANTSNAFFCNSLCSVSSACSFKK